MKNSHKKSKYPGFCQRLVNGKWMWGFRLKQVVEGKTVRDIHVHDFENYATASEARRIALLPSALTHEPQAVTLKEVADKYLSQIRASEVVRATRVLKAWSAMIVGDKVNVRDIRAADINRYAENRQATVGASTIDRDLNIIIACLNSGRRNFAELEQWQVPPVTRPKFSKATTRVLVTPERYRALCAWFFREQEPGEHSRVHYQRRRAGRLFRYMMLTGTRTGEASRLSVADLQPEYRRILIHTTKTDQKRFVPLTEELQKLIDEQCADNLVERGAPNPFVFTRNGKVIDHRVYTAWHDACRACNIPSGKKAGFTFYSSRHTLITELLYAGEDLRSVGSVVGHGDVRTTMHYAHQSPQLLDRMASLTDQIERQRQRE